MRYLTATLGAFALALTGTTVQSAPPGSAIGDLRSAAQAGSGLQQIAYRLCWTAGGTRQCRWVDNARIYGYRGAPRRAVPRVYGYTALPAVTVSPPPAPAGVYSAAPLYNYVLSAPRIAPPEPTNWSNPNVYPTGSTFWWRVLTHEAQQGSGGP
jgi:hypothetical protein